MRIIEQLKEPSIWRKFWEHKLEAGHTSNKEEADLYKFYKNREYSPIIEKIINGEGFNPPVKKHLSKMRSHKKRIVYTFDREENYVLKLMTYLLIRKYDSIFSQNLYSFRVNNGVHKALSYLCSHHRMDDKYVYKTDISNYFNSVDIKILLPMLENILVDDPEIYLFIKQLLEDPRVIDNNTIITEQKGIMAGNPLASFLADVYLKDLDQYFINSRSVYARYSDDIIVFSNTKEDRDQCISIIREELKRKGLKVNEEKEMCFEPHEKWEFLGISYQDGVIDVSKNAAVKLKQKMRRKARALVRWKHRKGADSKRAARAFIRAFNKKLYDNTVNDEMTWTRWYFPIINTTDTLREIDHYEQDCIRYIATEKHTKSRYTFTYEDMKALGYKSLVHEYYKRCEEAAEKIK